MIIIVEGPDGAGKTTLANYLSKHFGYPIKHRSKPNTEEEKRLMMQSYIDDINSSQNIVWDRCFYSEMVYGPVMRDQSYITNQQMLELERQLLAKGAVVFYCTDDDVVSLWTRCLHRGETYVKDVETLAEIVDRYNQLMLNSFHAIPIVTHKIGGK